MPSNLRIIHLRDLIEFCPEGKLDYAKMAEGVREIASVRGAFADYDVLIDTRGAESHLSAAELWAIAESLAQAVHGNAAKGFTAKIAVLCPVERFDHAKFLELCAQNRGLNVRAFTAFDDVFEWLSESSAPDRDLSP